MQFAFLDSALAKKIFHENLKVVGISLGAVLFFFILFSFYFGLQNSRTEGQYKAETLAANIATSLKNNDKQVLEDLILKATRSSNASTTLSVTVYDHKTQPVIAWTNFSEFDKAASLPASDLINEVQSR
jgi:membrane carboxypeptidase/penicillin-binding protein PbpC